MKKKDKFWKHLFIYVCIFLMLIVIVWIVLWTFLDSYEAGRPYYLADKTLLWIKKNDFDNLSKYMNFNESSYNTKESFINTLENTTFDKIAYQKKLGVYKDDKPVYSITSDGKEIAIVTLKAKNKKGLFGINRWDFDKIEMNVETRDVKIYVPKDVVVKVNGKELTEKDVINKDYYSSDQQKINTYVKIPALYEYEVKGIFNYSNIEVNKGSLLEKDNVYNYVFPGDDKILDGIKNDYSEVFKNYTRYVLAETGFGSISSYILPNSSGYEMLKGIANTNRWSGNHTPIEFGDITFKNMEKYSDEAFKVEVNYKYFYDDGELGHQDLESNLIIYMVKSNNKWYIADLNTQK